MRHGRIAYVGTQVESDIVVMEMIPQGADGR
jgi:hypothetical protein